MSKIALILFLLFIAYLILTAVFAQSGVHLSAPTGGGPSSDGIQLFLKTLGL